MATIKINTGIKTYDIADDNGNVRGQVSFNPTDANLYPRINKIYDYISNIMDEIVAEKDALVQAEKLKEADDYVKAQLNIAFCEGCADVVFGNQNVFNTVGGVSLIEIFLNAFMPIIEKECKAELKKSQARIEKYTKQVK